MATLEEINQSTKAYFIGADEVGYGALAGPLVVGAVRAPKEWNLEGLGDSKKLSEKRRDAMTVKLKELIAKDEISFHFALRSNVEIDKAGVAPALKSAYVECFHTLYQPDSLIIIDGVMKFDGLGVDAYDKLSLVKADGQIPTVMAASILAKTYRDSLMTKFHEEFPQYNWASNAGYGGCKIHMNAINTIGPCHLHRFSYAPMKNMKNA